MLFPIHGAGWWESLPALSALTSGSVWNPPPTPSGFKLGKGHGCLLAAQIDSESSVTGQSLANSGGCMCRYVHVCNESSPDAVKSTSSQY